MTLTEDQILLKAALSEVMCACAGTTNRVHALLALSQVVPEEQFYRVSGSHPDVMERDLAWAQSHFQTAKANYEAYCAKIGEAAYATYNDD